MAESSVTERTRQQGRRLKALRERTGISKGLLMNALDFKTSRAYDLYEDGTSVIRLDRVADWARAFNMTEQEFLDAVLTDDDAYDPGWDFLAELQRARPDDPEYTERTYRDHLDQPQAVQKVIVDTVRDLTDRENEIEAERQQPRQARAIAEQRAHYAV